MGIQEIKAELKRLNAVNVSVRFDENFEPEAGKLVEIHLGGAYWHLLPGSFLSLLRGLPDNVGEDAIRTAIEREGNFVWHGPAPEGSRDTSP